MGGEDFDESLVKFCITDFKIKSGVDITGKVRPLARLRTSCEKAKRTLSAVHSCDIDVEQLDGGQDYLFTLSRAKFEDLCKEFFDECMPVVE